jgi:hypothetical protein
MTTEALKTAREALVANDTWHNDYDEHGGYPESELCEQTASAIRKIDAALAEQQPRPSAQQDEMETRADGVLVRKDRWEVGIRRIVALLWGNRRKFEIDEVVEAVRERLPSLHEDGDDEALCAAVLAEQQAEAPVETPLGLQFTCPWREQTHVAISQQSAQQAADVKDAARYRWLREQYDKEGAFDRLLLTKSSDGTSWVGLQALDSRIDAAMKGTP